MSARLFVAIVWPRIIPNGFHYVVLANVMNQGKKLRTPSQNADDMKPLIAC